MSAGSRLAAAARSVAWYVKELMGDHDYARHVAHLRAHHPEAPVPTEREYWRARWAEETARPRARCC